MNRLTNRRRWDRTHLDGRHGICGLCDGSSWYCITSWDRLSWFDHTRFCNTVRVSKQVSSVLPWACSNQWHRSQTVKQETRFPVVVARVIIIHHPLETATSRFFTSLPGLPGDWLSQSRRCPAKDSCNLQHQDSYTFQEPKQWHLDQGHSRSLVPQSGMTCLPDWRTLPWAKTLSENCLKHFYSIDDCYIFAFAVFSTCAEKCTYWNRMKSSALMFIFFQNYSRVWMAADPESMSKVQIQVMSSAPCQ